jgi:hypothetical protein
MDEIGPTDACGFTTDLTGEVIFLMPPIIRAIPRQGSHVHDICSKQPVVLERLSLCSQDDQSAAVYQ